MTRSPLSLTLAGYAALALAIYFDDGAISDIPAVAAAILVVLAALAIFVWSKALQSAIARAPVAREEGARIAWFVALGSLAFAVILAFHNITDGDLVLGDSVFILDHQNRFDPTRCPHGAMVVIHEFGLLLD